MNTTNEIDLNADDYWDDDTFDFERLCADAEEARKAGKNVYIWKHSRNGILLASAYECSILSPWSDCHTVNVRFYRTCQEALGRWRTIHLPEN